MRRDMARHPWVSAVDAMNRARLTCAVRTENVQLLAVLKDDGERRARRQRDADCKCYALAASRCNCRVAENERLNGAVRPRASVLRSPSCAPYANFCIG